MSAEPVEPAGDPGDDPGDEAGLDRWLTRAAELVHDDPAAADALCRRCDRSAQRLELPEVSARARYLRARILTERGELADGLTLIEDARRLWWEAGARVQALRTSLGRMQILDDLGRHREAVAVGEESVAALAGLPPGTDGDDVELRGWLEAAVHENLGVACGFLGEHERALDAYHTAESAYRSLELEEETRRPRANRGIELLALGRGREALEVLLTAESDFARGGDRMWAAKCAGHAAQAHQQVGELLAALRAVARARAVLDELGAEAEAARLQLTEADLHLAIGLVPEARTGAEAAAARTAAAGMRHDAAAARFLVALADLDAGELDRADRELQAAGELFDEVGDPSQRARVDLALAELRARQGRPDEALELAAAAAETLRSGSWLVPLAAAELWLADASTDPWDASRHLDEVGRLLDQLRLPQIRVPYRVRHARQQRAAGASADAEALLRDAIEEVEHTRASLGDEGLRRAFLGRRLAPHDELVELLVGRNAPGDHASALEVSDRAKASTLVDLVAGTLGPQVRTAADALLSDLHALYGELLSVTDPVRQRSLRLRADELERRLGTERVRTASTEATPRVVPSPVPASWPERLLTYHTAGEDLIAFVAHERTTAVRLPGAVPLVHEQLARLDAQWSRFRMGSALSHRSDRTLQATAREILGRLYDLLVGPVAGLLDGSDGAPLVVVPSREVLDVPFHALHDGRGHLLDRWSVTVAPAALGLARPGPVATGRVLVLAVPDDRAPSLGREAHAVSEALPHARVLVGQAASSDALVTGSNDLDVLHIACHGLYRSGNPLFSSLHLADRPFTAVEVLDLDLLGTIVVLSACETGRQGGATAEPVGLAWAFLAAGARGVVVSHWLVDDDVTADLMSGFHRHLATGRDPAEALRRAQLAVAAVSPHPYHWAAFSYVAAPAATGSRARARDDDA